MELITFEQLPGAVSQLYTKLENIERLLLSQQQKPTEAADKILIIKEAAELTHLEIPTIYTLVSKRKIPHSKQGKRLYFSSKELTEWMKSGRKKMADELAAGIAETYTSNKKKKPVLATN